MSSTYLDRISRGGLVILDGATGTSLQGFGLTLDDFGGPAFEGCNELLSVTRPDVVARIHRSFFDVGVDATETNTFGAFPVPLGEYGIADRAYELSAAAAAIAREVTDEYIAADGRERWVAGSMGPGTKFASLGQVAYAELRDGYEISAAGLLDGGADYLLIETQFDLLGAKAAINGARRAMRSSGRDVPIQVQVTIELTGRMLPGTEIGAALTTLDAMRPDVIGINCATGPEEMYEPLRYLAQNSRLPIAVVPNAGLPQVVDGEMHYDLTATALADHLEAFVTEFGVQVIGGCCGTTPAHLAAVVDRCRPLQPPARTPHHVPAAASTYSPVPFHQDTSFLIIGERTNANGSRAFREALLAEDVDACLTIADDQVAESAHLLDVCVDYVGRDGVGDMQLLAGRFATEVTVPVVLDSTEPEVMEAGLELIGGRSVLNSANLEDGEAPGSRLDRVMRLAREHGAAVICLLIDERGQARTLDWKLEIAHRIHDLAVERYGLEPEDLIFDALTFPLSTGDDDLRGDAVETIEAIKRIKAELPGVGTVLGVSNVSFGLSPAARRVLNSVFLHECVDAGLDAAIIHAGKLLPLNKIPDDQRRVCLDLIYDRRREGYDPLEALLELFAGAVVEAAVVEDRTGWPVERRLRERIIDGDRTGLIDDLDEALAGGAGPLAVINDTLLDGMKTVGDLFASGEMQLPFVLRSAETMKAAVAYLEPLMDKEEGSSRGSIILATVRGDVHDIGKNLVDIILTNNGYSVRNLGIKVDIEDMIRAYDEAGADAIGMSGLLVKSTLIMRDNLDELERRGLGHIPILLGGAALTRSYVEDQLRERYPGPLYYGKDAFAGLDAMKYIVDGEPGELPARVAGRTLPARRGMAEHETPAAVPTRSPSVALDNPVFTPPFIGSRVVKGIPIDDVAAYLNETALFRNQWQYRPENGEDDDAFKDRLRLVLRDQMAAARADDLLVPQVVYGYFPANSDGDELIVWQDESRTAERTRFSFPRQSREPFLCISDFFRPVETEVDYAAFHLVTMGERISQRTAELFASDRYNDYLLTHGLGVEMAEALAEYWHWRIRSEWGFVDEDGPSLGGLFKQKYRGGRYSWGYPACPDLEDNETVADLLGAGRIGITVGEDTGFQYQPEQSTSAIICHHPQAKYFIARKPREVRAEG
ncbi:MAG: methionine synthase [Acidimicrobiia bacterium]|nr:methionine synthase [Acidimicrobiia bacterium]